VLQALQQKPEEALPTVRAALSHGGREFSPAWGLLALLLSSCGHLQLSLSAASAAVAHAEPHTLRLLLRIKAKLLAAMGVILQFPLPLLRAC
jgi:hypothetical protein